MALHTMLVYARHSTMKLKLRKCCGNRAENVKAQTHYLSLAVLSAPVFVVAVNCTIHGITHVILFNKSTFTI